jgi:hypothetical protein
LPNVIQSVGKEDQMSWREKYAEQLDNLATLSPDQLKELESSLIDEFDNIDGENGSLADLSEISAAISSVRDQSASSENSLAEMRANVHPAEDTAPDGEDDDDAESEDDDDEDEAEGGAETEPSPAGAETEMPVAVAASVKRPSMGQLARAQVVPPKRKTKQVAARVSTRMVAAGDIPGFGVGQEITTHTQLSNAFMRKLEALGRGGTPDDVLVASMVKEFPEDRLLGDDPYVNSRKIEAVINPKALVAYGGICQPLAVDYTIDTIGSTDRPVKNALPSFGASRGGVSFFTPPVLSQITPPVPWTVADDTGGTKTKACMRIACVPSTNAFVYGIPVCLEIGNMQGRFNPEQVSAQTALLDVAEARVAELTLLQAIDTGSIATTFAGGIGTTRDVLPMLDEVVAGYRYRYRLGDASLRAILPQWVKDSIRADMTMEMAHDRDGQDNLATADAQIANWFSARNVNIAWALEDLAGSFAAAQAPGPVHPWPDTFVAYLFAEGTWQFLDGGRIDVGVVRDSALNSTNDYQIWREDFEGVAKRGSESLKVTVTTNPTGASVGTIPPATIP